MYVAVEYIFLLDSEYWVSCPGFAGWIYGLYNIHACNHLYCDVQPLLNAVCVAYVGVTRWLLCHVLLYTWY